jgi:hypothetical protein
MLEELLSRLEKGMQVGEGFVYSQSVRACGPSGIMSLDLRLRKEGRDEHLLCLAIFPGRKPRLPPWIELFCLPGGSSASSAEESYYGSALEDSLLTALCSALGPGGRIFVEYQRDCETACSLVLGVPPALTRLGSKLLRLGFTWFKDWYFSEGGREGGQKLQAEKPLHEEARKDQMERLMSQARDFLLAMEQVQKADVQTLIYLAKARDRARELLDDNS